MNFLVKIIFFIFKPAYAAILFVAIFVVFFGYIRLAAKIVDDKPSSHKSK